jgi:hypothetical protein
MISKSISVSEQVNELSDFTALLFTWLIPHTDDYGVIPGSSRKLRALVTPMRKQSAEQVEVALKEMQTSGLIWRYKYKGNEFLQFCKFEEHQEGLHKRTTPKNPLYLDVLGDSENFREIPGNSRLIEPNLIEGKGKEEKEKEKYAPHITLTVQEFEKLVDKYGKEQTDWMIEKLDIWKGSGGKKTKSDYLTILKWVVKSYEEEAKKNSPVTWSPAQPKADPCCSECKGIGYTLFHTDDGSGNKTEVKVKCKCVR